MNHDVKAEVFEAFVNPEVTMRFWFTKSTGRLEARKRVTWKREMYGASAQGVCNGWLRTIMEKSVHLES